MSSPTSRLPSPIATPHFPTAAHPHPPDGEVQCSAVLPRPVLCCPVLSQPHTTTTALNPPSLTLALALASPSPMTSSPPPLEKQVGSWLSLARCDASAKDSALLLRSASLASLIPQFTAQTTAMRCKDSVSAGLLSEAGAASCRSIEGKRGR